MSEKTEIETLLPWYATDKLSTQERQKVDQYLAANPDMALQLDLIEKERLETVMLNEAVGMPKAGGLDRLMTRLDLEFGPKETNQQTSKLSNEKTSWLQQAWADISGAFRTPVMQFAGIAAALVIVLQSASLGVLVQNQAPGSTYTTASGPKTAIVKGTTLLVTFNPSATASQISKLLGEVDGSIIKGPLAGGFYQVNFDIDPASSEKITALTKRLESKKEIIGFVSMNE